MLNYIPYRLYDLMLWLLFEIINLFIKCRESKQNNFYVLRKARYISVTSRMNCQKCVEVEQEEISLQKF
jgi:hypothetical protein